MGNELRDKVLRLYVMNDQLDLAQVACMIPPDNPRMQDPINPSDLIPIRDQLVQEGYLRPVRNPKDTRAYKEPFVPYEYIQ